MRVKVVKTLGPQKVAIPREARCLGHAQAAIQIGVGRSRGEVKIPAAALGIEADPTRRFRLDHHYLARSVWMRTGNADLYIAAENIEKAE